MNLRMYSIYRCIYVCKLSIYYGTISYGTHKFPKTYPQNCALTQMMYDDILFVLHSMECNGIFSSSSAPTGCLNDYVFLFCKASNHLGRFLMINL